MKLIIYQETPYRQTCGAGRTSAHATAVGAAAGVFLQQICTCTTSRCHQKPALKIRLGPDCICPRPASVPTFSKASFNQSAAWSQSTTCPWNVRKLPKRAVSGCVSTHVRSIVKNPVRLTNTCQAPNPTATKREAEYILGALLTWSNMWGSSNRCQGAFIADLHHFPVPPKACSEDQTPCWLNLPQASRLGHVFKGWLAICHARLEREKAS